MCDLLTAAALTALGYLAHDVFPWIGALACLFALGALYSAVGKAVMS